MTISLTYRSKQMERILAQTLLEAIYQNYTNKTKFKPLKITRHKHTNGLAYHTILLSQTKKVEMLVKRDHHLYIHQYQTTTYPPGRGTWYSRIKTTKINLSDPNTIQTATNILLWKH